MVTDSKYAGESPLYQEVIEYLEYRLGHLIWIKRPPGNKKIKIGSRFGTTESNGYIRGQLKGKRFLEHRLVYYMFNKVVPKYIDHINGDRSDNRIENLRVTTVQQNTFNRASHKGSSSKYKGVSWYKRDKQWQASCCIDNKRIHIGKFDTEEEAAQAYDNYVKNFHKEFARKNL